MELHTKYIILNLNKQNLDAVDPGTALERGKVKTKVKRVKKILNEAHAFFPFPNTSVLKDELLFLYFEMCS